MGDAEVGQGRGAIRRGGPLRHAERVALPEQAAQQRVHESGGVRALGQPR